MATPEALAVTGGQRYRLDSSITLKYNVLGELLSEMSQRSFPLDGGVRRTYHYSESFVTPRVLLRSYRDVARSDSGFTYTDYGFDPAIDDYRLSSTGEVRYRAGKRQRYEVRTFYDQRGEPEMPRRRLLDTIAFTPLDQRFVEYNTSAASAPIGLASAGERTFDARGRPLYTVFVRYEGTSLDTNSANQISETTYTYREGPGGDYVQVATYIERKAYAEPRVPTFTKAWSYAFAGDSLVVVDTTRFTGGEPSSSLTVRMASHYDHLRRVALQNVTSTRKSGDIIHVTSSRVTNTYLGDTDLLTHSETVELQSGMTVVESRFYYSLVAPTAVRNPVARMSCFGSAGLHARQLETTPAPFPGAYQLIDLSGRVLAKAQLREGEAFEGFAPVGAGVYYLRGVSAAGQCVGVVTR